MRLTPALLVAVILPTAACGCAVVGRESDEFTLTVDGVTYEGYSHLQILGSETSAPVKTELNVIAYTDPRDPYSHAVTLRLYNGVVDLRPFVLEAKALEDTIVDPRDRSGYDGPPPNYVLMNDPKAFWSTSGDYELDFTQQRRLSGRFSAHLTTDVSDAPPRDIDARFGGPLEITCWVPNGEGTNTLVRDAKFETDFCAPFKKHDAR